MYKYTKYEQETIILFNELEKTAEVYTYNSALRRKLEKGCILHPDNFKVKSESHGAKTFTIPKKYVSVRIPPIRTPEQMQRQKEHMAAMRNKMKMTLLQKENSDADSKVI
jgi:hypothetical protein